MKNNILYGTCVLLLAVCFLVSPFSPLVTFFYSGTGKELKTGDHYTFSFRGSYVSVSVSDRESLRISSIVSGNDKVDIVGVWGSFGGSDISVHVKENGVFTTYNDRDGDGIFEQKVVKVGSAFSVYSLTGVEWQAEETINANE